MSYEHLKILVQTQDTSYEIYVMGWNMISGELKVQVRRNNKYVCYLKFNMDAHMTMYV